MTSHLLKYLTGESPSFHLPFIANVRSYDKLTFQNFLRNHPDFRHCIRPECPFGQLHDAEDGNIFSCATCGHRSCVNHNVDFHSGETCEQYDVRKAAEVEALLVMLKASMDVLDKETKKCPGCESHIQESRGCDHMTCNFTVRCGNYVANIV
jgi:hypothetical protein